MNLLIVGGALGLLTAVAFLTLGLRGRRVGDHRHCRKCGYDLHGQPKVSERCPECGTGLSLNKAIAIGERRVRRSLLWTGVPLLLLALIPTSIGVVNATGSIDWYRHWPGKWLARDASRPSPDAKALAELLRRSSDLALSVNEATQLAEAALTVQQDTSIQWDKSWGLILENLHTNQKLSDAHWRRYIRQAVVPTLKMRSKINADAPVNLELSNAPQRMGSQHIILYVTANNLRLKGDSFPNWTCAHQSYPGWNWTTATLYPRGEDLGEGDFVVEVDLKSRWRIDGKFGEGKYWSDAEVAETRTETWRHEVSLASKQSPFSDTVKDPARRRAMRDAIQARACLVDGWKVEVSFKTALPVRVIGRLFIRTPDGKEIAFEPNSIDFSTRRMDAFGTRFQFLTYAAPKDLKWIDVILRPDVKLVGQKIDDEAVWGEEIVLEKVLIE